MQRVLIFYTFDLMLNSLKCVCCRCYLWNVTVLILSIQWQMRGYRHLLMEDFGYVQDTTEVEVLCPYTSTRENSQMKNMSDASVLKSQKGFRCKPNLTAL